MGKTEQQKKQVHVAYYENEDNFLVKLATVYPEEEVLLLKSEAMLEVDEVLKIANEAKIK